MKIGVISDLHLKQIDGASDSFRDEILSKDLERILNSVDILVVNGDVFDLIQSRWFPTRHTQEMEFLRARWSYPKTTRILFNDEKVFLVSGNHDRILLKTIPSKFHKEYRYKDLVYVTHGDYEWRNTIFSFVGTIMTWLLGWFERLFGNDSDEMIKYKLEELNLDLFKNDKQKKKAIKIYNKKTYKYIIMGHTHRKETKIMDGFIYDNTGLYSSLNKNAIILEV